MKKFFSAAYKLLLGIAAGIVTALVTLMAWSAVFSSIENKAGYPQKIPEAGKLPLTTSQLMNLWLLIANGVILLAAVVLLLLLRKSEGLNRLNNVLSPLIALIAISDVMFAVFGLKMTSYRYLVPLTLCAFLGNFAFLLFFTLRRLRQKIFFIPGFISAVLFFVAWFFSG